MKVKESSLKISVNNYIKSVEYAILKKQMDDSIDYNSCIKLGKDDYQYYIKNLKDMGLEIDVSKIKLNITEGSYSSIYLKDNKIEEYSLVIDNKIVTKKNNEVSVENVSLKNAINLLATTINFDETTESILNIRYIVEYYPYFLPSDITISKVGTIILYKQNKYDGELTLETPKVTVTEVDVKSNDLEVDFYRFRLGQIPLDYRSLVFHSRPYIRYIENGEEKILYSDQISIKTLEEVYNELARDLIINFEIDSSSIPITDPTKEPWEQEFKDVFDFVMANFELLRIYD